MDKRAKIEIIGRFTIVLMGLSLLFAGVELQTIMIAHVIGGIVYLGMAIFFIWRRFGFQKINLDMAFMVKAFSAALPFAGGAVLWVLYSRIDVMMIHYFIGEQETGIYAVAFRCIETTLVVAAMVGVAMYPTLSRTFNEEHMLEFNRLFTTTTKWLGLLGMLGVVMLITIGDKFLVLIFSQKFYNSGELVRWMAVLFLLGCIKVPYSRLLLAVNRENILLRIQGLSVGLNVIINLILIPKYGAYGAVVASIVSETIMVSLFHISCARVVPLKNLKPALKFLFAGCIGLGIGIGVRTIFPWPVAGALSFGGFCGLIFILKLFNKRELEYIAKIFNKIVKTFSFSFN